MAEVNWRALAITVGAVAVGLGAAFVGGHKKPHGEVDYGDVRLMWRDGATAADAGAIADYWRGHSLYKTTTMDVELSRDKAGMLVFCPVMKHNTDEVRKAVRVMATFVSLEALDGKPVVPQVCDFTGSPVATLPAVAERHRVVAGHAHVWYRDGATQADATAFAKIAEPDLAVATDHVSFEMVRTPSPRLCLLTTDKSLADPQRVDLLLGELVGQLGRAFPTEKVGAALCDATLDVKATRP